MISGVIDISLNMVLPRPVEDAFYENILGYISDELFIQVIDQHLSFLLSLIDSEEYDLVKDTYESSRRFSAERQRRIIQGAWGEYLDLAVLDFKRKKQIALNNEVFVEVKRLIQVADWISGGTQIKYFGEDGHEHIIDIEYPFFQDVIIPDALCGAIYYDRKLVPLASGLEVNIVAGLKKLVGRDESLDEALGFIISEEYWNVAKKIGRKSNTSD